MLPPVEAPVSLPQCRYSDGTGQNHPGAKKKKTNMNMKKPNWVVQCGTTHYAEAFHAASIAEAIAHGREWLTGGDYASGVPGVYYVGRPIPGHVREILSCEAHDCSWEWSDPLPSCEASQDGAHDWQRPHHLVGGVPEHPGEADEIITISPEDDASTAWVRGKAEAEDGDE